MADSGAEVTVVGDEVSITIINNRQIKVSNNALSVAVLVIPTNSAHQLNRHNRDARYALTLVITKASAPIEDNQHTFIKKRKRRFQRDSG